ncbi:MAG: hypothetical protein E7240_04640 [Lachnospiraceae bacterium]|nr:hypothetical protein [Lachnospiraceae bacterium]
MSLISSGKLICEKLPYFRTKTIIVPPGFHCRVKNMEICVKSGIFMNMTCS